MTGIFKTDDEHQILDGALDGARSGIDRHKPSDAIYQQMQEERLDFGIAPDGLPKPMVRTKLPLAPTLHRDTLVCMGDTSSFVIRDNWGGIVVTLDPSEVERCSSGKWRTKFDVLRQKGLLEKYDISAPKTATPERLNELLSIELFRDTHAFNDGQTWVEVEPIRPQCIHYARQMTDFGDDLEHKFVERLCTARRDSGGEFLSLRDNRMYACELREPANISSVEKYLDTFDQEKVELGIEREKEEEVFDVDAALRDQEDGK